MSSVSRRVTAIVSAVVLVACGPPERSDAEPEDGRPHSIVPTPTAPPRDRAFDGQGHRGARGLFPENTVAAGQFALDQGLPTIELDLAVSRDSALVVSHEPHFDATICSLADGPYDESTSFSDLTLAQIQTVDCGSLAHPEFPYQQAVPSPKPSLREFVIALDAYASGLGRPLPRYNMEIKSAPELDGTYTPGPGAFARLVAEAIARLGLDGRVTVQSFDPRPLAALHRISPKLPLAGLVPVHKPVPAFREAFGDYVDICSPHHLLLTRVSIEKYHAAGLRVIPWTVNDKSRMRTLISWDVDGIITDYPDRLAEVLRESVR